MPERKDSTSARLTRDHWIQAALAAIAEGGLTAVAVEPLATRLGTTKGSFYWHFVNREALLQAALGQWEEQTTTVVIGEINNAPDDPPARLRMLVTRVIALAEQDAVGPALMANAKHPSVQPVLSRVTRARIGLTVDVLRSMGFDPHQAKLRAMLAYSAYLGHAQLAHSTPELTFQTKQQRREYLEHVLRTLGAPSAP
ncbi:TetR/AcrR family transcriptional regulator [Rhizocola hellebori]|uniref:TetR/AcrR family transcriptional regulator n=1 Tax=Rhizocola hellebori TaxID=1392758 RepID=UPI00194148C4|nr:TetR/AcrR family transcriptional regulator [Rhizocola hellebori]